MVQYDGGYEVRFLQKPTWSERHPYVALILFGGGGAAAWIAFMLMMGFQDGASLGLIPGAWMMFWALRSTKSE